MHALPKIFNKKISIMTDIKLLSTVMKRPVLKQQYITPTDMNLPSYVNKTVKSLHKALPLNNDPNSEPTEEATSTRRTELDGFYLLECTGMGFPEDAQQVVLSDKKLTSVVADDFTYFTELLYMDVSENFLTLEPFGAFPKLRELRMACNNICNFSGELLGFESLMYLDLSYNQLSPDSVQALDVLPNLRELDLCGNNLQVLPVEMFRFFSLEKLLLDYNKIADNHIFSVLAAMPNVRQVSLANNFLSNIAEDCCANGGLRLLELLDLSFNYFPSESSVEPIITLPRLMTVMLYGNPVLGPTGEDPMYIYIEGLVERAADVRDNSHSNLKDIEFLTEIPRKRTIKKGQALGRQALYRDFAVVQIDTSTTEKSNREWRMKGAKTIFAEAMQQTKKQPQYAAVTAAYIPDLTFLTSSVGVSNYGVDKNTDVIADDVMQKVAQEMGILSSAELLRLRDRVKIAPNAAARHIAEEPVAEGEDEGEEWEGQEDRLPNSVFNGQMHDPHVLSAQPVSLKTAMKALHLALKQPLTDYNEVPSKFSLGTKEYVRSTASSKTRQLPRIVAKTASAEGEDDDNHVADRKANKYKKKGLSEPQALRQLRQEQRDYTLAQIDQVLDNLNEHTQAFTGGVQQQGVSALQTKDSMHSMRHFAKPYRGVRDLMAMVDEVVDEFNK